MRVWWWALVVALGACSGGTGGGAPADGGVAAHDASEVDAALPDASPRDAASRDASPRDAASRDASAPGTVRTTAAACDPGAIAQTCTRLTVSCPDVADLSVDIRVTMPTFGPTAVILLGTGGGGQGFFDATPAGAGLVTDLAAGGFLVVQREWASPGWFAGARGVRASSCRYATLLAWVDRTFRPASVPLCALGLSGGAIEIGYDLARWDGADRLAGAILLGGPSMSRLDVLCPSVASAAWLDGGCRSAATHDGLACASHLYCTLQTAAGVVDSAWTPMHPCTDATDPDVSALSGDGVVAPGSRLSYPTTKVRFVIGADECSVSELPYYDAITSDRSLVLVPGTSHDVTATDAGVAATLDAVRSACANF